VINALQDVTGYCGNDDHTSLKFTMVSLTGGQVVGKKLFSKGWLTKIGFGS